MYIMFNSNQLKKRKIISFPIRYKIPLLLIYFSLVGLKLGLKR